MRPSRLRAFLGPAIAACFAVNAAFPGLPHGCEMAAGAEAPAHVAGHHAHHHGEEPAPRKAPACHCVGHSCCAARLYLPTRGTFVFESVPLLVAGETPPVQPAIPGRPRFLLPPALAPPLST
ncbi:MAG TPA: hypothetical protein VG692_04555 [Gemmatimonadales bacterium]|nr:hypothetical protein [Gemmatimonadales bacterium]